MRETTDGRYVEVTENEWWDTTGTALVDDDEIESYLEANPRVGIMVRETSAEMAERETGSPRLH
jgi:tRNA uridine 5-carbamoylmethylation protein Kti12